MRRSFGKEFDRILVCVGAGGGCTIEDTTVYTNKYGFLKIQDLWEKATQEGDSVTPIFDVSTGNRILDVSRLGWKTYGIDQNTGLTVLSPITQLHMIDVSSDSRTRVVLGNEAETIVSDWHPYFVVRLQDGLPSIVEIKAQEMRVGDLTMTPCISVPKTKPRSEMWKYWLAGLVAGDGHFADEYQIDITSADDEILEKAMEVVNTNFKSARHEWVNMRILDKKDNASRVLRVYSGECVSWISRCIGGFKTNKVSSWNISPEIQTDVEKGDAFIGGLFDSDGYIGRKLTGCSLANSKAVEQLENMLSIRGVELHHRENEPREDHWKVMHCSEISERGRKRLAGSVGRYVVCKRKILGLHEDHYKHGAIVKGFSFDLVMPILEALRTTKTSKNGSHVSDEEGKICLTAWMRDGTCPRERTVSRLVMWMRSKHQEMTDLNLDSLSPKELCRIAGIKKRNLRQLFGFGSHRADKLWRFGECGDDIVYRLKNMASAYLSSAYFARVPAAIGALEAVASSSSTVVSIEKVRGTEQFYDMTVEGSNSYVASLTGPMCFVHNTGSGSVQTIIKISHDIAESFKLEKRSSSSSQPGAQGQEVIEGAPAVGCLVSMPMTSEGPKVNANAAKVLDDLFKLVGKDQGRLSARSLSPLIVVDNERIDKMHPNLPVDSFWPVANSSITGLFHLFNNIATRESEYTTFDRADLNDVMKAGVISFGATPLRKFDSPTDVSFAVRDNLRKNVLVSDINLGEASKAACVFIGHPEVMKTMPQNYLEHGFEMLSRIMSSAGSTVHRGIYKGKVFGPDKKPGLVAYTIIGELGRPEGRMDEIYRIDGTKKQP